MNPVVLTASVTFAVALVAPWVVKPFLVKLGVIDVPTARSSHTEVTLRGMGLATSLGVLAGAVTALFSHAVPTNRFLALAVAGCALCSALLGWIEDIRGLSIRVRASAQLLLGLVVTVAMTANLHVSWWWLPLGVLAVSGYINAANFMDGVNGISGIHGLVVGALYSAAGVLSGQPWLTVAGVILAAAFAAFLPWNLGRGKVFLGDVGSYLLGGGIAAMAVGGFLSGIAIEYLLSPLMIYLADTGYTLVRRYRQGKRWYESHREHVYQRLTDVGFSHVGVAVLVGVFSAVTGICGIVAAGAPWWGALAAQVLTVAVLVTYLALPAVLERRRARRVV
ncbi:MraY family glycosyltransferase [Arthrobacter woluwensis]|uniref:MraY family glycosyltransferase n=1 Tax=Arthrobacter woluwensis TaxID=156980 RepID=UPI001AAFC511|nr:glycosyltransferase family 4 protein [Arthrobacter woluwensis]QTF71982.1 glycosyltransferase family 4 protein [Arthrobacter woluwensis]